MATLNCEPPGNGGEWKVEKLRFDSDFAEFELTALGRNLLKSNPTHVEKFPVFFEKVVAQGKLDLPRIAAEVPSALRLREHTKIDSGQVQFSVQLASSEKGREWKADVTASQLAATADGRILRWEQPIVVKLQMQQSLSGDWKGDVACVSDYLEVKANGSPEAGTVAVTADLTQLAEDLEPLVDLGGLEMAGRLQASIDFARTGSTQIDINGQGIVEDFHLSLPEGQRFEDQRMTIRLQAQAALSKNKLVAVHQANFRIDSTGDHAVVRLTDPVTLPQLLAGLPLEIRASGQLTSWLKRISVGKMFFTDLPKGYFDAELRGRFATTDIQLEQAHIKIQNLKLPLQTGQIEQSSLVLTGSGRWDRVNNQIADVALALRAPAFAVWTERLNVQIPVIEAQQTKGQKFPVATGTVFLRGDLASLQPWIVSNQKDSDFSVSGKAEGKFALESNDRMIALESELAIRNFSIQPAVRKDALVATRGSQSQIKPTSLDPIRQEQQLTLSGRLMYDHAEDRLQIERLTTGSRGLGVRDLAGTIEGVSQRPVVKLEGQLFYDLTQVTRLLNTYMDDQLVMVGKGSRPIFYRGPLTIDPAASSESSGDWWKGIQAGTGFSWDFFQCFGLRGGQGAFRAELEKGLCAELALKFLSVVGNYGPYRLCDSIAVRQCFF